MSVKKITVSPEYSAPTHGVFHLEKIEMALPEQFHQESSQRRLIVIPAVEVAGNHTHLKKQEAFFAAGPMFLHWKDEKEEVHIEEMQPQTSEINIYIIEQNTPHAFKNPLTKEGQSVIMFEDTTEPEQGSPASEVIK